MRMTVAALIASAQTPVQNQPPAPDDEIVVTGQTFSRAEIGEHVAAISETADGQLARFARPVCPIVHGMDRPYAEVIEARIRAVAQEVAPQPRVGAADQPCRPNLVLIITPDIELFMAEAHRAGMIDGVGTPEVRRLLRETGPVRVWNVVQTVNEDFLGTSGGRSMRVMTASIITRPTQQIVSGAVVVVDRAAVMGKTLTQIADYAAMRTLAETRPPQGGQGGVGSILSLFDAAAAAPAQVTAMDLAFLRGLYRAPANRNFNQQRSRITTLIGRELESGPERTPRQ
jgi:hypothetical protein